MLLSRGADGINCIVIGLVDSLAVLDALLGSHPFSHGSLDCRGGSDPGAAVLDVELLQVSLLGQQVGLVGLFASSLFVVNDCELVVGRLVH